MRKPSVIVKIDGIEAVGWKEAAERCGSTEKAIQAYCLKRENRFDEYEYKGHIVKIVQLNAAKKKKPLDYPDPKNTTCQLGQPDPYTHITAAIKSVKEELRYTRECLLGGIHRVDEIAENVRSIERRVIEEKKVRGIYHGGFGGSAEKLG